MGTEQMQSIHLIGIGGVGMNGIAQLAALSGLIVTGSDRAYTADTYPFRQLEHIGIRIFPQDGSGITEATSAVVYSTAIEDDNPDLIKAKQLKIPTLHRAQMLNNLIGGDELIAVAGTAGKSTVTGLLGWIFESLGKDPSVYNGAAVLNWKNEDQIGNVRKGKSNLWIIEADESDRSFLNFHPSHTIITNISKDHYELDELHRLFDQFCAQTTGKTIRGQSSDLSKHSIRTSPSWMIGEHNRENMQNALRLCEALEMDLEQVLHAIDTFKGIERRLEVAGSVNGITVMDDYAHNPVKISAALSAVSAVSNHVHAFWRPHGFAPLFQTEKELINVFTDHHRTHPDGSIFILPVYYAGGTVNRRITSEEFVAHLNAAGIPAVYVESYTALEEGLRKRARSGDAVLGMGARDPELPRFAKKVLTEW